MTNSMIYVEVEVTLCSPSESPSVGAKAGGHRRVSIAPSALECRGERSKVLPRSQLYTLADLPGLFQRSVAPELQASKLW